jgi:hypothetical protein
MNHSTSFEPCFPVGDKDSGWGKNVNPFEAQWQAMARKINKY